MVLEELVPQSQQTTHVLIPVVEDLKATITQFQTLGIFSGRSVAEATFARATPREVGRGSGGQL